MNEPDNRKFELFCDLTDELQFHVLSFVAEAPCERIHRGGKSTSMVKTLPLVSKKVSQLVTSNAMWKIAFERVIQSDKMWKQAAAKAALDLEAFDPTTRYRQAYEKVYKDEISFTGPVFVMSLGEDPPPKMYSLYLFEPRYRYMITQLLDAHRAWVDRVAESPEEAGPEPPMYFLHAHNGFGNRASSGRSRETALLVQLVRCSGTPRGHYDVTLQVDAIVRLEHYWVAPNTGHLFYARGRRIANV